MPGPLPAPRSVRFALSAASPVQTERDLLSRQRSLTRARSSSPSRNKGIKAAAAMPTCTSVGEAPVAVPAMKGRKHLTHKVTFISDSFAKRSPVQTAFPSS